uniref:Secreted protein n=1 Tax=Romanomermis culicivorax TaxID=13658 RepID=A0A915L198_ROMCU
MATMILVTPRAIITTVTAKAIATATIINNNLHLPPTLANDAAIEKKLLYTHVQRMLRPRSKATVLWPATRPHLHRSLSFLPPPLCSTLLSPPS